MKQGYQRVEEEGRPVEEGGGGFESSGVAPSSIATALPPAPESPHRSRQGHEGGARLFLLPVGADLLTLGLFCWFLAPSCDHQITRSQGPDFS